MKEDVERRLTELRSELETGQRMLAELESQEAHLRKSLLRIGGAVQVLEELLAGASRVPAAPGIPANGTSSGRAADGLA